MELQAIALEEELSVGEVDDLSDIGLDVPDWDVGDVRLEAEHALELHDGRLLLEVPPAAAPEAGGASVWDAGVLLLEAPGFLELEADGEGCRAPQRDPRRARLHAGAAVRAQRPRAPD